MKRLLMAFLLLTAAFSAKALSWGEISVYESLDEAVEAAKAQRKMLFALTGTSWCPHCLDLESFLAGISGTLNADYVVYYCDGEADKTMYTTEGYPTWGIFNPYLFEPKKRWKSAGRIYKGLGFTYEKTVLNALDSAKKYWERTDRGANAGKGDDAGDVRYAFYLDLTDFPTELKGYEVLDELLPTRTDPEAVLLTSKQKMKVVAGANSPSSLKMSFNKRQQTFKGSFKIYAKNAKGKQKKFSARVLEGVLMDGSGVAVVTISGFKGQTWTAHLVAEGL